MTATLRALFGAFVLMSLGVMACGSQRSEEIATLTPPGSTPFTSQPATPVSTEPVPLTPTPTPSTVATQTHATATAAVMVPPTELPATVVVPQFVDNQDCSSVSRVQLPLADVIITDGVRSIDVVAEMARNSVEQSQGLMCRAAVPEGTGMLFLWDSERTGGFWMFNTYVPLDIIYFGGRDGNISIIRMTPCPREGSEDDNTWRSRCASEIGNYLPDFSYTTTLELPQGWLAERGFDTANPGAISVSLVARG